MDDWELLRLYAEGSEGAFADLLRRHVDPVYSAALRRIGDPQIAQDITQRVFCLLARKASSLPRTGSLIGWLHRTTCHLASETLRSDRRRRDREAEAARLNVTTTESATEDVWQRVAPQLDEALLELPETDRLAVLLRFFQRLPLRDVGERLGVSEAAAKMRVGRAVMKLRQGLGARGITLTALALVWLLADKSVVPAPAGFESAVKVTVGATGAASNVPPRTALLAWLGRWGGRAVAVAVVGVLLLILVETVVGTKSAPHNGSIDFRALSELSESNVVAFDATGPDTATMPGVDRATPSVRALWELNPDLRGSPVPSQ